MRDPNEHFASVGDVELCYDTFGDLRPRVLLIMGLGTQMIAWPEDFCEKLAARGFHVIRFDNRDCGRSTHLDGAPTPTLAAADYPPDQAPAYKLQDMARDAAGLLDALGIQRAHVVGASMGGDDRPDAGRSSAGAGDLAGLDHGQHRRPDLRAAEPRASSAAAAPPRRATASAYIEQVVDAFELLGSPGFERDEAELRELLELLYDRGRRPARLRASAGRDRRFRHAAPTPAPHHGADAGHPRQRRPARRPSGGRATARAIPGANLLMVGGMGHDLPRDAWPLLIDAIAGNAARAERGVSPAAAVAA